MKTGYLCKQVTLKQRFPVNLQRASVGTSFPPTSKSHLWFNNLVLTGDFDKVNQVCDGMVERNAWNHTDPLWIRLDTTTLNVNNDWKEHISKWMRPMGWFRQLDCSHGQPKGEELGQVLNCVLPCLSFGHPSLLHLGPALVLVWRPWCWSLCISGSDSSRSPTPMQMLCKTAQVQLTLGTNVCWTSKALKKMLHQRVFNIPKVLSMMPLNAACCSVSGTHFAPAPGMGSL